MRSLTPGEDNMLESLRIRRWSTVATLAFLLYEHTITFREEVSHIWRRPVTAVRAIFMFSRYFTLIVQTVNVYLVLGPFSATTIAESTCKKWFLFQITAACALMTALDLILMLMIYALYRKNKRIGILLTTLFFAQIIVESALSPKAVLDVSYDPICDTTETHSVTIYFCMSVWITHISLAALTGFKKDLLALGAPVVKRVIRDGTWILVVVCSLFATIVPYSFAHQVSQGHVVFGWPTAILSIACCRIIINMRTLDYTEGDDQSGIDLDIRDSLQILSQEIEQCEDMEAAGEVYHTEVSSRSS